MSPPHFALLKHAFPSLALIAAWLVVLRSLRNSGWGIALISLPGTMLHELARLSCGFLLLARPVSVNLLPRRRGRQWVLGSVAFRNLNIWNSAFVALAPLLLIGVAVLLLQRWMQPALLSQQYLSWLLAGYAVACALFSCMPSTTDIRVGARSAIMWASIGFTLWYLYASKLLHL